MDRIETADRIEKLNVTTDAFHKPLLVSRSRRGKKKEKAASSRPPTANQHKMIFRFFRCTLNERAWFGVAALTKARNVV
jgi:hypothetical protein